MGDKKAIEIAGNYLLKESLKERANKTEFSERDLVWEDFYSEVRGLGYQVYVNMQLQSCVVNTKDKRLIPIIQKYIEKFKNIDSYWDYEMSIGFLGDIADKSLTDFVLENFKQEQAIYFKHNIGGAKYRWGDVLFRIADHKYIDEYLNIITFYVKNNKIEDLMESGRVILLLSKLKVVEAIPVLLKILNSDDKLIIYNCRNTVIEALGNYKLTELRPYIAPYLTNSNTYTRNKAKAAIAKIERAEVKRNKLKK